MMRQHKKGFVLATTIILILIIVALSTLVVTLSGTGAKAAQNAARRSDKAISQNSDIVWAENAAYKFIKCYNDYLSRKESDDTVSFIAFVGEAFGIDDMENPKIMYNKQVVPSAENNEDEPDPEENVTPQEDEPEPGEEETTEPESDAGEEIVYEFFFGYVEGENETEKITLVSADDGEKGNYLYKVMFSEKDGKAAGITVETHTSEKNKTVYKYLPPPETEEATETTAQTVEPIST